MKKIIIIGAFLFCFFLSACGNANTAVDIENNNESYSSEGDRLMVSDYSNVVSIRIVDTYENMYQDEICINIDSSNIQKIIASAENLTDNKELMMRKAWYNIEMLDEMGNIVNIWTVDTYRTIQTNGGYKFERTGEIDTILSSMEEQYNISKEMFRRPPGANYYQLLKDIKSAFFRKIIENNFDDDINYSIPSEMIYELINNISSVTINNKRTDDYIVKYTITFYNSEGNTLYTMHIDNEYNIYTNSKYGLSGTFIEKWIADILSNATEGQEI